MFSKEERPWGWFETIEESETYKLKKIHVNPNQQFSLQYHDERDEHWIIVDGSGVITLGENRFDVFQIILFLFQEELFTVLWQMMKELLCMKFSMECVMRMISKELKMIMGE